MKRFLLICALCALLCSCADTRSPSDRMAQIITEAEGIPDSYFVYYSGANENSEHYLREDLVTTLYGEGTELNALCEDYAILIGGASVPWELHILRARALSGVPELLDTLSRRKDLLAQRKNAEFCQEITDRVGDAVAYSNGRLVLLLVTDHNESIRKFL